MDKVKIGVFGGARGSSMIEYCRNAENAEIVAICDKREDVIKIQKKRNEGLPITYYDNFDDFIKHDMDAVVLANYANEHAPFAIRCMNAGKHVFSEVLPVQMMKEAVELVEAVEKTGKIYAYGENYCYMSAPYEMRRLYKAGEIGEFEYGEGEYIHNCESIWPEITYGDPNHWRNHTFSTFYCTHSLGPIIHITGLRPVSVVGFEGTKNERSLRIGAHSGAFGMEMVTLENGGIIKSIHGGLYKDSIWYSIYGSKGSMESGREITGKDYSTIFIDRDEYSGGYGTGKKDSYEPKSELENKGFGHGGSDFYTMYNFVEKIRGKEDADIIDVYEAMDMFLPGLFAYMSILDGNKPKEIPNLRDKAEREKWRNNTFCTDAAVAGDMLVPTFSKGNPDIPAEVYESVRLEWERRLEAKKKKENVD